MRIGQGETAISDLADGPGQEYFRYHILKDRTGPRLWISVNLQACLIWRRALNRNHQVANHHGNRWRPLDHRGFAAGLAPVAKAAEHAWLKNEVIVSVGHVPEK